MTLSDHIKGCESSEIMDGLVRRLHDEACSCVIRNSGVVTVWRERGVKDLFRLFKSDPQMLSGSIIADKVVGKGAAALMISGGVCEVYADVISEPALDLLRSAGLSVNYRDCVPNIINRSRTGICPVESLCAGCKTAVECIPLIERFLEENG